MAHNSITRLELPQEQEAIRAKCFHPTGTFVEFKPEDVEQSIPSRFEQIVRKYADRIAVKTNNHQITYDGLNRAANRVAQTILTRCGEEKQPVALLLGNDRSMISSVLGALKAGKIYVPLDPAFPKSRNTRILADSGSGVVVTDNRNSPAAAELAGNRPILNLDQLEASVSDENPVLNLTPDTLAYILYTSGSTGEPKGVLQNHRNVIHLIMRYTNGIGLGPNDRVALLRSFSVHGGTFDTFAALLNGATALPFDLKQRGVLELAKWLAREEISVCRWCPTAFRHLAAVLTEKDIFPKLRAVSFSGEPLYPRDVQLCKGYFSPDCIFINWFGATETSSCCQYRIGTENVTGTGSIPCGFATADMEILLLDDDGKETAVGQIGEIAVRSRYLALGYWRRPELTRARFLPDPEGTDVPVYLTGDLGRLQPDGCLVHLGRKDFQIKLRGYRIELGEIESALMALPNVQEAAAVAREDASAEQQLMAYVVPVKQPLPSVTALQRGLRDKLPDYMIPTAFIALDALPLTPNGKVDRRALPAAERTRPELEKPFVAPRTPVEVALASIWADVLKLDKVGIHDHFFDLGGHSLAATRVVSRVIKEFQLEIPLQSLFQSPTVAEMAAMIIKHQTRKLGEADLNRLLAQLESLSDEDADRLLKGERE